jgi:sulfur relay (sulfurtransferase) complex TusBCD TusD component (DsrE family)
MNQFLIVETRDPLEHPDVERTARLAAGLQAEGCGTTIFLTENGVIAARAGVAPFMAALGSDGVTVAVDRVALAERGMAEADIAAGMEAAGVERVVDALLAGARTIWR